MKPDTNEAPMAVDDVLSGLENTTVMISAETLTANDTDADDLRVTVHDVGNAVNGMVERMLRALVLLRLRQYVGHASFEYTVADPYGATSTATVTVEVAVDINVQQALQYPAKFVSF